MKTQNWSQNDIPSQRGRIAIVTGGNSGIGLETARELARQDARVVLACRSEERAEIGGALPTLRAATALDVQSGDYFGPKGFYEMRGSPKKVGTTESAKNEADAAQLWSVSEEGTGVRFDFQPPEWSSSAIKRHRGQNWLWRLAQEERRR